MKLSKIFLLAGAVLAFASCSEKEEWNTSNEAVVSMAKAEMTVSEATGMFNVPFVVSGERNAPVQVTFEVTPLEGSENLDPAIADVNYLLTSNVINVSAEAESGSLEVITVDDEKVNEKNRAFKVTIISVKGGSFNEESATTIVTLKDPSPYEAMAGKWTMTAVNASSGAASKFNVTVHAATEDEPEYNNTLYITGFNGYDWTVLTMSYNYNYDAGCAEVSIIPGLFAEGVDFGLGGINNVIAYNVVDNSLSTQPLVGEISEDSKSIDFGSNSLYGDIVNQDGSRTGYRWFWYTGLKMSR